MSRRATGKPSLQRALRTNLLEGMPDPEGLPVAAQHATQLQLPPLHENSALNSMRPYCGMCCSSRSSEENCGRVVAGVQEAGRGI